MNGLELQGREFFAAIREGREPNASVAQALPCYRVLDDLERRRVEGRRIVDAIADRVSRGSKGVRKDALLQTGYGPRLQRSRHLSSAVNFWIFLHAFSSCSSDVA